MTADLKTATSNLPNSKLKTHSAALLNTGGSDYNDLLQVTDAWFNRQMDRVSGWYRRQSQAIVLVISALLVFFLGVTRCASRPGSLPIRPCARALPARSSRRCRHRRRRRRRLSRRARMRTANSLSGLDNASFLQVFLTAGHELDVAPRVWVDRHVSRRHSRGALLVDVLMKISNMRFTGPKPDT